MTRAVLIIVIDVFVVIAFSVVQIVVSNHFSTTGIELAKIQAESNVLEKENTLLREKIYTAASYNTIASAAASMGFIEKPSEIVFTTPLPLAIK